MSVVPPIDLGPYPQNCTDASWKAAKTTSIRDKWNTELGAALRAAQVAYNKVKIENLTLNLYTNNRPGHHWEAALDVELMKTAAQQHYNVTAKPAIKALDSARSKAATAGRNPVISAAARAKARQIAIDLAARLAQLKSFKTDDYTRKKAEVTRNLLFAFQQFNGSITSALANADDFVTAVRNNPTAAQFNDNIGGAARRLTQNVGQVRKFEKNGHNLGKDVAVATRLFNTLDPWANDRVKVAANANRAKVLAKVIEFNTHVNAVKQWWQ